MKPASQIGSKTRPPSLQPTSTKTKQGAERAIDTILVEKKTRGLMAIIKCESCGTTQPFYEFQRPIVRDAQGRIMREGGWSFDPTTGRCTGDDTDRTGRRQPYTHMCFGCQFVMFLSSPLKLAILIVPHRVLKLAVRLGLLFRAPAGVELDSV